MSKIQINEPLAGIIAQMPGWADAKALSVRPLGGLTNTNYLVTVAGSNFDFTTVLVFHLPVL